MAEGVPGFSLSEGNGNDDMIATKGLSNRVASQQFPFGLLIDGEVKENISVGQSYSSLQPSLIAV